MLAYFSFMISIIIPVYNREQELAYALASILEQTHRPLEVIIVDDGSKRPVSHVVEALNSDISITLIRHDVNKGAPAARNRGLQEAKGTHVIFWDADVVAETTMLEQMIKKLEEAKDSSFAYANSKFGWKKFRIHAFDPHKLKQMNYIHTTSLIRREHALPWDETLRRFQDWDLWLRMLKEGRRGVWIDEFLYRIIPSKQGISSWLPSFAYKAPWRHLPWIKKKVKAYEEAKEIIKKKHGI